MPFSNVLFDKFIESEDISEKDKFILSLLKEIHDDTAVTRSDVEGLKVSTEVDSARYTQLQTYISSLEFTVIQSRRELVALRSTARKNNLIMFGTEILINGTGYIGMQIEFILASNTSAPTCSSDKNSKPSNQSQGQSTAAKTPRDVSGSESQKSFSNPKKEKIPKKKNEKTKPRSGDPSNPIMDKYVLRSIPTRSIRSTSDEKERETA